MGKFTKITMVVIGVLILVCGTLVVENMGKETKSNTVTKSNTNKNPKEELKKDKETEKKKDLNPFGNTVIQRDLKDYNFAEYIHRMSHQKVEAENKWGFYKITDKRIDWLLDGLEHTWYDIDNEEVYRDILKRWKNNDFSRVDKDHNEVWKIQGGTDGKATGILNEKEEKAYIESNKDLAKKNVEKEIY